MNNCGIYKITNTINNKCYIGRSINCKHRLIAHKRLLNTNKHFNTHLQNAFKKHGENSFKFEVIFLCQIQDLENAEMFFISSFDSFGKMGYNKSNGGETNSGFKHTKEACQKISTALKGHVVSEETRRKIGVSSKGKLISIECREKIKKSLTGNTPWNKGLVNIYSEETLKNMSENSKGKHYSISTEFKKGMVGCNKGKIRTEEHKKNLSQSLKGRIPWNKGLKKCQ